mmetsp:Transcript_32238/g.59114  ORF Transcript_32238/g.59114 Transcript_32238/m.59114 type:complete len:122 (-) Transcript_32238:162-527(-)
MMDDRDNLARNRGAAPSDQMDVALVRSRAEAVQRTEMQVVEDRPKCGLEILGVDRMRSKGSHGGMGVDLPNTPGMEAVRRTVVSLSVENRSQGGLIDGSVEAGGKMTIIALLNGRRWMHDI